MNTIILILCGLLIYMQKIKIDRAQIKEEYDEALHDYYYWVAFLITHSMMMASVVTGNIYIQTSMTILMSALIAYYLVNIYQKYFG